MPGVIFVLTAPVLYHWLGLNVGILSFLPVLVGAWWGGTRSALLTWLATLGINAALYPRHSSLGVAVLVAPEFLAGHLASLAGGLLVGRLRDVERRLSAAIARRKKVEQDKHDLLRLVVHDLKGPLGAIIPATELLLEKSSLDREDRTLAGSIQIAAGTMRRLVQDLLSIQEADDGQLRVSPQALDLPPFFDELGRELSPRVHENGTALSWRVQGDLKVWTDRSLLKRIVTNLVDNAAKYANHATNIKILASCDEAHRLQVRVCDDGPGVPEALKALVFDRLFRTYSESKQVMVPGSQGLGLAFCRLAVEAQGGRIWVEDNAPRGAVFCVTLPAPAVTEGPDRPGRPDRPGT